MMGRQATGREQLFYTFSMEDHVPQDHLLRGIHHFLDLSAFRQHLEPFYSPVGRPSIDPELMIRMLIVGYCFGIRSERRLCRGSPQPGLSLVLPAGSGRYGAEPLDVLQEPAWSFP